MKALASTEVPVPAMHGLCEDPEVIGTAFFVCDYVEGRVLWDPTLPELSNEQRAAHYGELNRVIAALHSVDYAAVGLADYGKPGSYLARQVDRWTRQYHASETEKIEAMDNLVAWLPANIPPGEDTSIVHGDYRIDNVIFHPTEPRILAVLDWELSTLGHPLVDFAYHCMTWRMPEGAHGRGLAGADLPSLGIPTEKEYIAMYCRSTGRADGIPHFDYYVAFNMFRLAAILQGVKARALQGNAASGQKRTPPRQRPEPSPRKDGARPSGCKFDAATSTRKESLLTTDEHRWTQIRANPFESDSCRWLESYLRQ